VSKSKLPKEKIMDYMWKASRICVLGSEPIRLWEYEFQTTNCYFTKGRWSPQEAPPEKMEKW
jgi:hypothetical protein